MIFDTLRVKASLIVACSRRLAFAGETRFMLNKHEANRLWRFCLRRLRTFFAKKVLRTPKNAQGDNIDLVVSLQFYNPSKISADNLDTSSKV